MDSYLVLLRTGFTIATSVTSRAVRSYRTFSPLPILANRRFPFCCTFRRLAPPRRYLAFCPMEPGLSSLHICEERLPSRLRRAPYLFASISTIVFVLFPEVLWESRSETRREPIHGGSTPASVPVTVSDLLSHSTSWFIARFSKSKQKGKVHDKSPTHAFQSDF